MLKVQLTRDLRKNILRGHPWVYREAIKTDKTAHQACLCRVIDRKGKDVAWGLYSPQGPLALRILSTASKPPNAAFYQKRLLSAWKLREPLRSDHTNAFRLINGEGDGLPGLVCDVYNNVAVLQFDGDSCYEFWDQEFVAQWLLNQKGIQSVYCKPRRSDSRQGLIFGQPLPEAALQIKENGVQFVVDIVNGQKTGFFLDQRDNRAYLQTISRDKRVLNLFSYTGGFSLYAGRGGAQHVTSVDLSEPALAMADEAWLLNGLDKAKHEIIGQDVFQFIENQSDLFQIVMVDPPSMTHSEKTKGQATRSYIDLFAKAAQLVEKGHHLVLSSCSSHISFQDFFEIIDESLSKARRRGQILRVSGQGFDHPFPHACRELRYLKFVDLVLTD